MDKEIAVLTFNVDLDDGIFRTVADKFIEHILGIPDTKKSDMDRIYMNIEPEVTYVHIAVFFARSMEVSRRKMTATERKLQRIFCSLKERQPTLTIRAILLVDCGEVGMLPLSQFVAIQNMIEYISNFVSDTAVSRVFSIDCEENAQSGDAIHIYDTSTLIFKNRMLTCFENALSSLNRRFGNAPLPKF